MKYRIWKDERWPDWGISEGGDIEIPVDLLERWRAVNEAYDDIQAEVEAVFRAHKNRTTENQQLAGK